jgi:hypothetical protein
MQQSFIKDHRIIQISYRTQEIYTSLQSHEEENGFANTYFTLSHKLVKKFDTYIHCAIFKNCGST